MATAWCASAPTVPVPPAIVHLHTHHGEFVGVVVIPTIVPFLTERLQSRATMAKTN
jgi:hypothetical protein